MNRSLRRISGPVLFAALAACGGAAAPDAPMGVAQGSNLLLVVVDTLRADHLGCYGYERETSPAVDALAAGGVRFERAYSVSSWTKPSVASILTGRHPEAHGVTDFPRLLDASVPTLATILADAGYRTAGVVSHNLIGERFAFDRGFELFDEEEAQGHRHVSTGGVTRRALAFLDELAAGDAPFFLFVHYFDPHYDYRRHEAIGFAAEEGGRVRPGASIERLRMRLDELTADEVQYLRDLYDDEIGWTDRGVGELLGALDARALAEETLVVFTADHGEDFMDHGWIGHVRHLYEEVVRVPLIVAGPGVEPGVVAAPVSSASIAPTVLELLGLSRAHAFTAPSLRPGLAGGAVADAPVFFGVALEKASRSEEGAREPVVTRRGVVMETWKLVVDDLEGRVELYDLAQDLDELDDLAAEAPERVAELRGLLQAHAAALPRPAGGEAETELTDAEVEELQKMGYLGDDE